MRIIDSTDREAVARLASRDEARNRKVEREAATIINDVRRQGDAGLIAWTQKLDNPRFSRVAPVSKAELRRGWEQTPVDVRKALKLAANNLTKVASKQVPRDFVVRVGPGHRVEQRVQPLGRVGCYVPAGRHPLPSTLLMTVVPARVAGVRDIVVVCPRPAPVVMCAALEAGVTAVFAIGGAQAIGALAYGTESIARVDKIVGPGNAWVAAAKALVSADCAIDLHAGPSEIVLHSDVGNPEWIAADLIAQAEHDPAARAIFVTTKRRLADLVSHAVDRQMPSKGPAGVSIAQNGAILLARSKREAIALVNQLAPEHLVIDSGADVNAYTAAGTIFVGPWSAQAAGDYCTGSNHVLPTGGAARFRGGLSASDFVRVFSVQTLDKAAIASIGPSAVALAEAEGLTAHAGSIRMRL
ncbi:MAG: histidinol dehydrogenase [Vicinamibacterales bacterium]